MEHIHLHTEVELGDVEIYIMVGLKYRLCRFFQIIRMPIYCYTNNDGDGLEEVFRMGDAPQSIERDGKIWTRNYTAEHSTKHRPGAGWPMKPCVSTGVNAVQAQDLRDFYRKHGETIEVSSSGDPIYTSQRQMNRDLKLRGFRDMN